MLENKAHRESVQMLNVTFSLSGADHLVVAAVISISYCLDGNKFILIVLCFPAFRLVCTLRERHDKILPHYF